MEKYEHAVAYGFITHEDKAWFYNYTYGAIFEVDVIDEKISLIWMAKDESFLKTNQYGSGVWYDNKLIFSPREANKILIFDLNTNEPTFVDFDYKYVNNNNLHNKFIDALEINGIVYFFPGRYKSIMKLDVKTKEVSYTKDLEGIIGTQPDSDKVAFANVEVAEDGKCILPCWQMGGYVLFDTKDESIKLCRVGDQGIADVSMSNNLLWIALKDVPLVKAISKDSHKEKELDINVSNSFGKYGCRHIFEINKKIFVIPFSGDAMVTIDNELTVTKTFDFPKDFTEYMKKVTGANKNTLAIKQFKDGRVLAYECKKGEILLLDGSSEPKKISTWLTEKDLLTIKDNLRRVLGGTVVHEEKAFTLEEYFQLVM